MTAAQPSPRTAVGHRGKRRRILAAASVVTLTVILVAWPLSYHADFYGGLRLGGDGHASAQWHVRLYDGCLWISHYLPDAETPQPRMDRGGVVPYVASHRYFQGAFQRWSETVVELWCFAALAVLPPAFVYRPEMRARTRRRRRASRGLCPACGYDLRASSGRCPECGETPVASLI